jgi:RHS repeat-associated protein
VTFVHDNAGRVKRKQDQLGDTVTYTFDLAGRMTTKDYRTAANSPTGTIADSDTFTFDRAGRMLTAASGRYSNTVTYTFDPIGRKATEALTIGGQTYTITSEYNSRGELTKVTYPDSSISERTYHATGALNQLKLDGSTISTRTYDDGRRLTGETLGNGVTESRTYASDNLLTAISFGGTGTSIGNLSYTWDSNKNKTSETIGGTMSNYGFTSAGTSYDDEDRLTGFARASGTFTQSWSLTSVGDWNSITTNGTAQNRTHGPTHELLTAGGQNVTTDVKGNITLLPTTLTTSGVAMAVGYDFDNKLKSADVDNNGSNDVTFQYDALGRRVARQGTSGSFVYVQQDQQTIADYGYGDAPSSPTHRYVYASYIDEPVVRKAAGTSGTIHYYHRNQQYSITAVTTSSGSVAERYAYTAYGQPSILDGSGSALSSSAINNRYTYTGREWDQTLGLYHFRARWMSGLAGRFMARDPIGYWGSAFLVYEYVNGSPLRFLDPFGLKCVTYIYVGHLGNVTASVNAVDPKKIDPCDKLGVACCFIENTMEHCVKHVGNDNVIPDWPPLDLGPRNQLIYDKDWPVIFDALLDSVVYSMDDSCNDKCKCKRASTVFLCDWDSYHGIQEQVQAGKMTKNWCNMVVDMNCSNGILSTRPNQGPTGTGDPIRLPIQPVRPPGSPR